MSQLVQRITSLIKDTQSMDEAVKTLTSTFKHLSTREAKGVVEDILDFSKNNMTEKELEHWLSQRGLTA